MEQRSVVFSISLGSEPFVLLLDAVSLWGKLALKVLLLLN